MTRSTNKSTQPKLTTSEAISRLQSEDPDERWNAVNKLIAILPTQEFTKTCLPYLSDPDWRVRALILHEFSDILQEGFAAIANPNADDGLHDWVQSIVFPVARLLEDRSAHVVLNAITVLSLTASYSDVGYQELVEALEEKSTCFNDEDTRIKCSVIKGIAAFGRRALSVLPTLEGLRDSSDTQIKEAAVAAIGQIKGGQKG